MGLLLEPWPLRGTQPNEPTPALDKAISDAADRIIAERVVKAIVRETRMSKLGAIADRIKAKKEAHDAKADEWASRLDAIDQREPHAFAIGDAVIAERDADLAEMEATMRTLSNLPNVSSTGSS